MGRRTGRPTGRPRTPWSVLRVGLRAVSRGATQAEGAVLAGVSEWTLNRAVAEHGVGVLRERQARPDALRIEEREETYAGIARGESNLVIAERLGRSRSTIWREITPPHPDTHTETRHGREYG